MGGYQPFSRGHSCRVSDAVTYSGFRAVVLENDLLRMVVLPEKGAEIHSVVYKPQDMDVLFKRGELSYLQPYPAALVNSEDGFIASYHGGWQEIFPSGGSACQVGNAFLGTHGEVFLLPWRWQILEDTTYRVSVRFQVRTLQMPFLLERTMSLEKGSALLRIEETLLNESPEELPFMWGHHPVFGEPFLDGSCVLDAPAARVDVHQGEGAACHRLAPGSQGDWPLMQDKDGRPIDLRFIPAQQSRVYDMFYLTELTAGWCALTNRKLGFGIGLVWDIKMFPILWVWQELCGSSGYPWYSQTYALGLEPFTGYTTAGGSGLAEVIKEGRENRLAGHAHLSTELKLVCYPAEGMQGIAEISGDGIITFRK
jgi:galactose mutarotase-like enzyme